MNQHEEDLPLCSQCGRPLTKKEDEGGGQVCYVCNILALKEIAIRTNIPYKLPTPEQYGRTQIEVDAALKERRNKVQMPKTKDGVVIKKSIPWTVEERKKMIMDFGFDPGHDHETTITVRTDANTSLTFEITEKIEDPYKGFIQDVLQKTLDGILKILIFGPHHPEMESLLQGPGPIGPPKRPPFSLE